MLDHMTGTAAGQLCFRVLSRLPQAGHMLKPQVTAFHVNGALPDMVLNVGICCFILRAYVLEREFISSFRRSHEGGGIVRDEACLPAVCQILPGTANQVVVGNKSLLKLDYMAGGGAHSDRVP